MQNKKTLIGAKPFFYLLSDIEGYDINTPLDFKIAEFLFNFSDKIKIEEKEIIIGSIIGLWLRLSGRI